MKRNITSIMAVFFSALLFITACGKDKDNQSGVQAALTDIPSIAGAADRRALVGRSVDISNGLVQSVVGNYVFWAGDSTSQIPVVRLDKEASPVIEHVKRGETVRMVGTVRLVESTPANDPMWEQINPTERAQITEALVYIAADSVQIVTRP